MTKSGKSLILLRGGLALVASVGGLFGAPLLMAQPGQGQAVVQPLPPEELKDLKAALNRLSRNPKNLAALIAAGDASLDIGDIAAARGFYARAQKVAPDDPRAIAGLAATAVRSEDPFTALALFDQAQALGLRGAKHASDRALAYDLLGQNNYAQQFYREALRASDNPETRRRFALSRAISGDLRGAEATLLPLLKKQDLAAYRTRAFALAIAGKTNDAMTIAEAVMRPAVAKQLEPYLAYMDRLTPAQQAAAGNFGHFPRASQIGKDGPQVVALAKGQSSIPVRATSSSRLLPRGRPLGEAQSQPQNAPRGPTPTKRPAASGSALDAMRATQTAPLPPSPTVSSGVIPKAETSRQLSQAADRVADAFAGFDLASQRVGQSDGAVDITTIEVPREVAAAKPDRQPNAPPPELHPSRVWVQVATGRDRDALWFDFRRIKRNAGGLLDQNKGLVATWGQTNRLLTGPFDDRSDAQEMVTALKGKGIESFLFKSQKGEEVVALTKP